MTAELFRRLFLAAFVAVFLPGFAQPLSGPGNPFPGIYPNFEDFGVEMSRQANMTRPVMPFLSPGNPYPIIKVLKRECVDSDGGANFYLKGKTYYLSLREFRDVCISPSTLQEGVCDKRARFDVKAMLHYCVEGCFNGACVNSSRRYIPQVQETRIENNASAIASETPEIVNYTIEAPQNVSVESLEPVELPQPISQKAVKNLK